jgi:hypothetical protein
VFTAHKHQPATSTHQVTLQGVVYQLDAALQNPVTQRAGIVFIYDMSNSKYSNFDYDLSQKILTLLKVSTNCCVTLGMIETSKAKIVLIFNLFVAQNKRTVLISRADNQPTCSNSSRMRWILFRKQQVVSKESNRRKLCTDG